MADIAAVRSRRRDRPSASGRRQTGSVPTDTVIVGGGVMGSAAAWALARRGVQVLLLEQFGPGHRLGSSHGSSRIFRLAYAQPFYVRLARTALPLWRELAAETGQPVLALTGAVDHGSADELRPRLRTLLDAGERAELLTPAEAERRWPVLRVDTAALFHPTAGRLHADDAVRGFQRAARSHGAELRHDSVVEAVSVHGADSVRVHTASGTLAARRVVVAAGSWARALLGPVLPMPRLRVTQEQPAHFAARDPAAPWPSFIHHPYDGGRVPSAGVYGLASADGIKVGLHGVGPEVDPARRHEDADRISTDVVLRLQLVRSLGEPVRAGGSCWALCWCRWHGVAGAPWFPSGHRLVRLTGGGPAWFRGARRPRTRGLATGLSAPERQSASDRQWCPGTAGCPACCSHSEGGHDECRPDRRVQTSSRAADRRDRLDQHRSRDRDRRKRWHAAGPIRRRARRS